MSMNALTKPKILSKSPKMIEGYPGTKKLSNIQSLMLKKLWKMNFVKNCHNPEIHGKKLRTCNQKLRIFFTFLMIMYPIDV